MSRRHPSFLNPTSVCLHAGLRQRVEASLGGQLAEEPQLFLVRDVAPKKLMVEVSFRLPASIAFGDAAAKRQRLE